MPPTLTILYRELCFLGSLHSRRMVLDSTLSLRSSQNTKPRLFHLPEGSKFLNKCSSVQLTSGGRYHSWVTVARLWVGRGLPVTLTSSITSLLLHERLALVLSDDATVLFPELHNFPRHFKPRKEGILAWITEKREEDTRIPRSCASPQLSLPLIVFSHCPAKAIKEDVFKWLLSRA